MREDYWFAFEDARNTRRIVIEVREDDDEDGAGEALETWFASKGLDFWALADSVFGDQVVAEITPGPDDTKLTYDMTCEEIESALGIGSDYRLGA